MILVTGATGTNGQAIVQQLAATGTPVRALVRDPARATQLHLPGVELVTGDFTDARSLAAALEGIDRALLLSAFSPDQVELQSNFIKAAQRAGTAHIVKFSALGASPKAKIAASHWHGQTEAQLEASELPWTMLQPSFFMQNTLQLAPRIASAGAFYLPCGDGKAGFVDVSDIAAVAVKVLTEPGHEYKRYLITGPEALTYAQVAEKIAAAIHKPVNYVNVTPEAARTTMLQAGMPEWLADALTELYGVIRDGYGALVTHTVSDITKHRPRTFDEFAHDYASVFRFNHTAASTIRQVA